MRAAVAATTIVLLLLIWFSWDRLAPELVGEPGDVAAPPPLAIDDRPEASSPPPVPDMPDERYATAGPVDADSPRVHVVSEGDTLWSIAVQHYGDGHRARAIYEANRDQIGDPANLREGQELVLP